MAGKGLDDKGLADKRLVGTGLVDKKFTNTGLVYEKSVPMQSKIINNSNKNKTIK